MIPVTLPELPIILTLAGPRTFSTVWLDGADTTGFVTPRFKNEWDSFCDPIERVFRHGLRTQGILAQRTLSFSLPQTRDGQYHFQLQLTMAESASPTGILHQAAQSFERPFLLVERDFPHNGDRIPALTKDSTRNALWEQVKTLALAQRLGEVLPMGTGIPAPRIRL
jgi:hypothetical protein